MTSIAHPSFFSILAADLSEPEPVNVPAFTTDELEAMNTYCLRFRALVRGGGTPSKDQENRFMRFQDVCYQEGAEHE